MHIAPNAYLIGAQKAGTTLLAAILDQSPDVCLSDPKEPNYLSSQYHRGPEWYASCFANPEAMVLLDASTTYSFLRPLHRLDAVDAPGLTAPVPQRMLELNPATRLIYILRDPVARAVSAYKHQLRYENVPSGPVSLREVLDTNPMIELASRYADQIDRYLEVFEMEQMLFIDFRDLTTDQAGVAARVAAHLRISPPPSLPKDRQDSAHHGAHRATLLGKGVKALRTRVPRVEEAVRKIIPEAVSERLVAPLLKTSISLEINDLSIAAARFSEDRARVKDLTGLVI